MENKMFCFQCQEAAGNVACNVKGVCGKDDELAKRMDLFKSYLKQLAKVVVEKDVNDKKINQFIMNGLFKLITNANFEPRVFDEQAQQAKEYIEKIGGKLNEYDLNEWEKFGVLKEENEDLRGVKELIFTGLMGLCAYHSHAQNLGYDDEDLYNFVNASIARIDNIKDLNELIALVDKTGEYGVKAMALLDKANTQTFGNPEISEVNIGVGNNPGILVSGHDLDDLIQLLEQSKDSGVDIYTHSEMLPAHYYPKLKKYSHLVGNYGNSWATQKEEFETFNGPIVFTTNCIIPPSEKASYKDKLYATGNANHPGFKYIEKDENGKKDFSEVIKQAQKCEKPTEIESGSIVGGFAHSQVFALADKVVENVKNGSIRKFIVMAGCDGRHVSRNYYTDFASGLNKDTIILTAGCAKYRYNKLNLGDINGIPRVLDAGQCNDSYSLAVIALKLKEIFELNDINELPISYNIAWYEQKAVIVLLALLHLGVKNIKLGPTLPAFISSNVADFLIETFNISTIDSVESDLNAIG
ncbi:hydroxylamine reductase [Bacilli bacterium PM5-3]|nr:hydroxylamine reductase [Bacilli bacterium PM5-3]MDH6603195.1 hydroxylamine reductase [Bacilli bacterium PM5-9]